MLLAEDGRPIEPGLNRLCAIATSSNFNLRDAYVAVLRDLGHAAPPKEPGFNIAYVHADFERGYFLYVGGLAIGPGWGGPFASPYHMIRIGHMDPAYAAALRERAAAAKADAKPNSKSRKN